MTAAKTGNDDAHDLGALAAYLDDRLDDEERTRVEDHLVRCVDCRATLAAYARGAADDPTVAANPRALGSRMAPAAWLALAASAVLAIGTSVYLGSGPTTPPRPLEGGAPPAVPGPTAPPAAQSPAAPAPQPPPARSAPGGDLSKTRGAGRRVADKTFRLEAGTWVDTEYDPVKFLPTTDISTTTEREALLQSRPALRPYSAIGGQVIVVLDGAVYRFNVR